MNIRVKEVASKEELEIFIRFPYKLYSRNQYWVPPLIKDEMLTLDKSTNPAFSDSKAKFWLAYRDSEVVGRVAGIIVNSYLKKWNHRCARFGWIDFIDDEQVSKALLETVENWAMAQGMTSIHGPLGFTDFDPEGMLVEGYDLPGVMTTIYNFPYYPLHLELHGYRQDAVWVEYEVTVPGTVPERIKKIAQYTREHFHVKTLQARHAIDLLPYARDVFHLINKAYKNLYGVVQLEERQIDFYIDQFFSFIDPDFCSIILDENDKAVAFAVAMPSLTRALQKSNGRLFPIGWFYMYQAFRRSRVADLYLIGVHPEWQGNGVTSLIIEDLTVKFNRHHIQKAITHPILEKNEAMINFWKQFERKKIRKRCCFIKPLTFCNENSVSLPATSLSTAHY